MAVDVQLKDLLDAGVHFGHQVRRWNPKMRPFIYGERNGIHIIDLQKTQKLFKNALTAIETTVAEGGNVLFVATKKTSSRHHQRRIRTRWNLPRSPPLVGWNADKLHNREDKHHKAQED